MSALEITSAQIAREITGQSKIIVRFQNPMPAPAFNHPDVPAEYVGFTLQNNRLIPSFGEAGRVLTDAEIAELFAMQLAQEPEFWQQYAKKYNLCEVQSNTDPVVLCWPAQSIIAGDTPAKQSTKFEERFL